MLPQRLTFCGNAFEQQDDSRQAVWLLQSLFENAFSSLSLLYALLCRHFLLKDPYVYMYTLSLALNSSQQQNTLLELAACMPSQHRSFNLFVKQQPQFKPDTKEHIDTLTFLKILSD